MQESEGADKGPMSGGGSFDFFVVNISSAALAGTVTWTGGGRSESLDVEGLAPAGMSQQQSFSPQSGKNDYWQWSEKGDKYKLNVYDQDRYTAVVISDFGIGVLVTNTSPGTWSW
ncbi:hypothetical protein [Micromonospora tarensis]|uniref:Peptidase inhibitor family I36 n=1 Tax=Micromonospora tarensis TaxID=2806100 RepID=A0ABS1YDA7_9ACTN|nr:hypothetical protein [Micromonospora tarensis]MBM0275389.1 hypothetical protein [Micromonospora tarensis]